jgi:hypothetical protein
MEAVLARWVFHCFDDLRTKCEVWILVIISLSFGRRNTYTLVKYEEYLISHCQIAYVCVD